MVLIAYKSSTGQDQIIEGQKENIEKQGKDLGYQVKRTFHNLTLYYQLSKFNDSYYLMLLNKNMT